MRLHWRTERSVTAGLSELQLPAKIDELSQHTHVGRFLKRHGRVCGNTVANLLFFNLQKINHLLPDRKCFRCWCHRVTLSGMPLITLVLMLVIMGVCLWLLETYVPLSPPIKTLIRVVVVVWALVDPEISGQRLMLSFDSRSAQPFTATL